MQLGGSIPNLSFRMPSLSLFDVRAADRLTHIHLVSPVSHKAELCKIEQTEVFGAYTLAV
jgi:hypothetical protein